MRMPSPLDIHVFGLINRRYTHSFLDWFLPRLTLFGLGPVQLPVVWLVCCLHWRDGSGRLLLSASVVSFLLASAIVHLIKRRVKRMRPVAHTEVRFLVPKTRHGSFPSGHTATTFALATIVAWLFPVWTAPLLCLAALVGYSRVYVGVHFLSDVLAAAAIGIFSGAVTMIGLH
jgi:undecaprenyl-diphosphatase